MNLASLLTPRQLEVVELMCQGMPTKLISQHLGLSIYTVKEHRAAILQRMDVANVVELVNKVNTLKHSTSPTAEAEAETGATTATLPRLLLVDDDAFYRKLVTSSLQLAGYPCASASCSAELYALLDQDVPDIVLLDLNLDGEDGLDIARDLRTRFSLGIIIVTTRGMVDQRIDGLAVGADAYLVKPLDMRELVAVITNLHLRMSQWKRAHARG
ncbi:MAG: response regulator [Haliea sp.]